MATDILILASGALHLSNAAAAMTASTTQQSYAIDNAREVDLVRAWKPNDSAADEYLIGDLGSTSALGAPAANAWGALSYDTRVSDQTAIKLQYATTDDGLFAAPQLVNSFSVGGANAVRTGCDFIKFAVPGTAKRYYRLFQDHLDGRNAGGIRTAKIYNFELYPASGVISVPIDFPGNGEAAYAISQLGRTSMIKTPGGFPHTNRFAKVGYRFEINFGPAQDTLWQKARDIFDAIGGMHRAVYIGKEGVVNPCQPNFFMCRLTSPDWRSAVRYRGQYDVAMEFETEVWQ